MEAFMVDRRVIATEAADKQAERFEQVWMDWFHSLWCMANDESTDVSQSVDSFSRIRFFTTLLGAIVQSNHTTEGRELQLAILEAAYHKWSLRSGEQVDCSEQGAEWFVQDLVSSIVGFSSKLTRLDFSECHSVCFCQIDFSRVIPILAHPWCQIDEFDCATSTFMPDDVTRLVEVMVLPHNTLRSINLSDTKLGDDGAIRIANALSHPSCKVKKLLLAYNKITDDGVIALATALKSHSCCLESLGLSGNTIGLNGVRALTEALTDPGNNIEYLGLHTTGIDGNLLNELLPALVHSHSRLQRISLGGNSLGEDGVIALLESFNQKSCSITDLDISQVELSVAGCEALSRVLENPVCKIQSLILAGNTLSDECCSVLSAALKQAHCQLTDLFLNDCNISDVGISTLIRALKDSGMRLGDCRLEFDGNAIGSEATTALAAMLALPHKIPKSLCIENNRTDPTSLQQFLQAVSCNDVGISRLEIGMNKYWDNGLGVIAKFFSHARIIVDTLVLNIKAYHAEREQVDWKQFFSNLLANPGIKIQRLDFGVSILPQEGLNALAEALDSRDCHLRQLAVYDCGLSSSDQKQIIDTLFTADCTLIGCELDDDFFGLSHLEEKGFIQRDNLLASLVDQAIVLRELKKRFDNEGVSYQRIHALFDAQLMESKSVMQSLFNG
jgi:Ran GTPase-activating protein (RanGAP) involved in mRNA processing and transport